MSTFTRRQVLAGMAGAAAGWALTRGLGAAGPTDAKHPNIVFILADDLGYGDLGCYGQKLIQTPNIDALAAEGLRFTDAYAGSTVCAPSRCTLMTGLHTGHARVRQNRSLVERYPVPLEPDDVTVAERLKAVGYATGAVGKWGLGREETTGVPTRQGFDYWYGFFDQGRAHNYYPPFVWENETKIRFRKNKDRSEGRYIHDLFTEKALGFIDRHKDEPFFLYLPYTQYCSLKACNGIPMAVFFLIPLRKEPC